MRPQPAAAIFSARNSPSAAQAAGDDVGAVAAEDMRLLRGHHHAVLLPVRGMSSTSLPVCSAAPIARIAVAASASG